jgi:hypothetical protein
MMTRTIRVLAILLLAAASLAAAQKSAVAGKWTLAVDTPHGAAPMDLVLKQEGKKVAGTLSHGRAANIPLRGEFSEDALSFQTEAQGDMESLEFRGRLQGDGTLSGYFSGSMGDMKVTGKRAAATAK